MTPDQITNTLDILQKIFDALATGMDQLHEAGLPPVCITLERGTVLRQGDETGEEEYFAFIEADTADEPSPILYTPQECFLHPS